MSLPDAIALALAVLFFGGGMAGITFILTLLAASRLLQIVHIEWRR